MLEQGDSKGGIGNEPKGPRPDAPKGQGGDKFMSLPESAAWLEKTINRILDALVTDSENINRLLDRLIVLEDQFKAMLHHSEWRGKRIAELGGKVDALVEHHSEKKVEP